MKPRYLLIIIISIILLAHYSFSQHVKCTCTGKCHGRDVEQSVSRRYDLAIPRTLETAECLERDEKAFGAHCGGLSSCSSGCVEFNKEFHCGEVNTGGEIAIVGTEIYAGDPCYVGLCGENCECDSETLSCWPKAISASQCCREWCSGFSNKPPAYYGCIQSCESRCGTNELIKQIISLVQYISVIIAAIMLAVNGIKFITSDSPYDRDQAKHSIRYILTALIILALVTYIATAIFLPVRVPGGDTSIDGCTSIALTPEDVCLEACTEPPCKDINNYISDALSGLSEKSPLLDSNLVLAVMKAESGFHQCDGGKVKTSSANALGLMQLVPSTADWLGVDPCDAEDNVKGGVKYLNFLLTNEKYQEYGSPIEITLAAYNCGQGNIDRILVEQCISKGIAKADCTWEGHVKDHIKDHCKKGKKETLPYVSRIMDWYNRRSVTCSQ